ncbi:MAG: outer membrane protein assembly factor BamB family protein [Ktedonobacteraceae bacterium]
MTRTETILPPRLILAPDVIYAIQGDVYALEPSSRLVQHHYPIEGLSKLAIMNGVLYMNVTNGFSNTVQAVQASDGALLWRYPVDDPLAGKPSVGNGVLYVGTRNGSVLALRVDDGSLLWRYKFDYGPEVPLFKTPILRGSPVFTFRLKRVAELCKKFRGKNHHR